MEYSDALRFSLMKPSLAILITVFLALVVAASDYFLKIASSTSSPFLNRNFFIGLLFAILCTFAWVLVMPHLKLAYIGVVYSLTLVLSLCFVGTFFFGETLKPSEWLGVGLAVASLLLLYRVA
jgi:drug/metabolite transporter (DMT)-like permease